MPRARHDLIAALHSSDHTIVEKGLGAVRDALLAGSSAIAQDLNLREAELLAALVDLAEDEMFAGASPSAVAQCLALYGTRFNANAAVWRKVLVNVSANITTSRLRAHLHLTHEIAAADGAALTGSARDVLTALNKVLETTTRVELLPDILQAFSSIAAVAPQEFGACFQDVVDLLLGWAVDNSLQNKYRDLINEAFSSFKPHWCDAANQNFALSLQRKLLSDMRKMSSSPPSQVAETGHLHALLLSFAGIVSTTSCFADLYDHATPVLVQCADFYAGLLPIQPGLALSDLQLCLRLLCACWQVVASSASPSVLQEVLKASNFTRLRLVVDGEVRGFVLKFYDTLFRDGSPEIMELTAASVAEEFGILTRSSEQDTARLQNLSQREAEALAAFNVALMHRGLMSLRVLCGAVARVEGKPSRCLLLACIWDAADQRLSSFGGGIDQFPESLDDLVADFCDALDGGDVRHLLTAMKAASSVLWRCFSPAGQSRILNGIWSSFQCGASPMKEAILELAAALCPAGKTELQQACLQTYFASLLPFLPDLLDLQGALASMDLSESPVLAMIADLRGLLCEWGPTLAGQWEVHHLQSSSLTRDVLMAPQLRSLLATSVQLCPNALLHHLSTLRGVGGNPGDLSALTYGSLSTPEGVRPASHSLWLLLLVASSFVSHRLKSPFGQAAATLENLEMLLTDSLAAVAAQTKAFLREASGLSRSVSSRDLSVLRRHRPVSGANAKTPHTYQPLACVQLVYMLEQLILLAQQPVHVALCPSIPLASKEVSKFFDGNARVCGDWMHRMRGVVRDALSKHGSPPAHYMVSTALLAGWLKQCLPSAGETPLSVLAVLDATNMPARSGSGILSGCGSAEGLREVPGISRGDGLEGRVAILSDNSHVAAALEQNLTALLDSALAMRNWGICRGVFALYHHAATRLGCQVPPMCQEAFLAFAAQSYEEATELFSTTAKTVRTDRTRVPSRQRSSGSSTQGAADTKRHPLRALVARTWLDAAMLACSAAQVELWLQMYEDADEVSTAMRSFATSYMHLVSSDFAACRTAAAHALQAAADDVAVVDTVAADQSPQAAEKRNEAVCRLSSWAGLSTALLIDASATAKLAASAESPELVVKAFSQARACLHADMAARSYVEPCLLSSVVNLSGPECWEPHAAMLGLLNNITAVASKRQEPPRVQEPVNARAWLDNPAEEVPALSNSGRSAMDLAQLHYAHAFRLPLADSEAMADRLRLVGHCLATKNVKLASSLLNEVYSPNMSDTTDIGVQLTLLHSVLLESQQRVPQAFMKLHEKLDAVLSAAIHARAGRGLAGQPETPWLSKDFLANTSMEYCFAPAVRAEKVALLIAKHGKMLQSRGADVHSQWLPSRPGESLQSSLLNLQQRMGEAAGASLDVINQTLFSPKLHGWRGPGFLRVQGTHPPGLAPTGGLMEGLEPFQQDSLSSGAQLNPLFVGWHTLQGCLLCPSSAKLWSRYGDWLYAQRNNLDLAQIEQVAISAVGADVSRAHAEDLRIVCKSLRGMLRSCTPRLATRQRHLAPRDSRRQSQWPTAETFSADWLADRGSASKNLAAWQSLGASVQQQLAVALGDYCSWLQRWQVLVAREGLRAYAWQVSLEDGSTVHTPKCQRNLLRTLRLVEGIPDNNDDGLAHSEVSGLFTGEASLVPTKVWEPLLPQLLAYMKHPSRAVASLAAELFTGLVKTSPAITIFPSLAAEPLPGTGQRTGSDSNPALLGTNALQIVRAHQPSASRSAALFAGLLTSMATPVDETCSRCLQLATSQLAPRTGMDAVDCIAIIISRFSSMLQRLDASCGEGMPALLGGPPPGFPPGLPVPGGEQVDVFKMLGVAPALETTYARRFLVSFLPALRQMVFQTRHCLRIPLSATGMARLRASVLNHLHSLLRICGHFARVSSVPVQDIAPQLACMFETCEDPGNSHQVTLPLRSPAMASGRQFFGIRRVAAKVQLLATKTKPKRIDLEVMDGSIHTFLLKGREDLRLDEQIMQLLQVVNAIATADTSASTLAAVQGPLFCSPPVPVRCRDYDVVPIGPRAGLIRWLQAVPLFSIHKMRRQCLHAQRADKVGEDKKHLIVESSTDVWHRKVQQNLRSMGIDPNKAPRKNWPQEALRKTFDEMQADSPADLLSRELMLASLNPSEHFVRSTAITLSMAMMSVLGHVVGLGDRHLDNILLDLATGEVVHVDYSLCFDRGARLKVPERVPFRLTRCMVAALGPLGIAGLFHQTMVACLTLVREWREFLLALVEPCFLLAPINDWVHPPESPFRLQENAGLAARHLLQNTGKDDRAETPKDATGTSEAILRAASTQPGTTGESDDASSANEESLNEEGNEEDEEEPEELAGPEKAEEGHLAQDLEDWAETPPAQPKKEEPDAIASADEDDASEEGLEDRPEGGADWSAISEATAAVRSITRKIPRSGANLNIRVEQLLAAATHPDDLAQMYEGWTAWI